MEKECNLVVLESSKTNYELTKDLKDCVNLIKEDESIRKLALISYLFS